MIQTFELTKRYKANTALSRCSLSIAAGEVYGLLGPNGAGKSTLIRLLLGFLSPTEGRAEIGGFDVTRERLATHRQVSYLPSSPRLFRTMSGRRVLEFFAEIRADGDLNRSLEVAQRLDLNLKSWVAFMSTGMRQKLAISACFGNRAPLLILDEPTENLDPNVRSTVMGLVQEAKAEQRTVLFSSHVLSEVEEVADRIGILCKGVLVHEQQHSDSLRCHRLRATVTGPLPAIPESIRNQISLQQFPDGELQMDLPGDLAPVLHWLAAAGLENVRVEPLGLREVYDRFHSPIALPAAPRSLGRQGTAC